MELSVLVDVALSNVLSDLLARHAAVELDDVLVLLLEVVLDLEVDQLRIIDSNRTSSRLKSDYFINHIDRLLRQDNKPESLIFVDLGVHHNPLRERPKAWVVGHKRICSSSRHKSNWVDVAVESAHCHVSLLLEHPGIVTDDLLILSHASENILWEDARLLVQLGAIGGGRIVVVKRWSTHNLLSLG